MTRCDWCTINELYTNYHDTEWGVPCFDDELLFENLILESFQAGLSWYTVLKKRESFRAAFYNFDAHKMATMGTKQVDKLLQNPGIIRHRAKIEAAINNAQCYLQIKKKGSFADFIWEVVQHKTIVNHVPTIKNAPSSTPKSDELAKKLKNEGFKFVGSTTVYAFMQAMGLVNDHINDCFLKNK